MSRVRRASIGSFAALMIALLTSGAPPPASATDESSLENFIKAHLCVVQEKLSQIRSSGDKSKPHNRYLIISPEYDPARYTQCIFFDNDTKAHCEAASGWWTDPSGKNRLLVLSVNEIDALAKLGFDTTLTEENYKLETDAANDAQVKSLAVLMLTGLYRSYGVRETMKLKLNAPLASGHTSRCHPLS